MEPLGVTARLAGVVDLALRTTPALIIYARDTKHASSDRKLLGEETLFLSKLLHRLRDRAQAVRHDEARVDDHEDIVRLFEAAHDDLAMTLKYDAVSGKVSQENKLENRSHNGEVVFLQVRGLLSARACHSIAAVCRYFSRRRSAVNFAIVALPCGVNIDHWMSSATRFSSEWTRSNKKVNLLDRILKRGFVLLFPNRRSPGPFTYPNTIPLSVSETLALFILKMRYCY